MSANEQPPHTDYYSSLLERVDGAISSDASLLRSDRSRGRGIRSTDIRYQLSVLFNALVDILITLVSFLIALVHKGVNKVQEMRGEPPIASRRAPMNNSTPFSSLRGDADVSTDL